MYQCYNVVADSIVIILVGAWSHTNDPVPWILMESKPGVVQGNFVFDSNGLYSHLHLLGLIITID